MKEWFKARNIWGAAIATLGDEEAGRLMKALWHYTMNEEEEILTGPERTVFALMVMMLKQDDATETELSAKRAEAGSRGGKQKVANVASANFATTEEANVAIATNKNKNKEEDKDIKETLLTESKEKRTRFSPPSVEEVRAYCQERNNGIDAEAFVAFYASKGWKVGNSPMKDWKQCVITWEKRDGKTGPQRPAKTVIAQQYEQRDYSGVQAALTAEQDDYYARRIREKQMKKVNAQLYEQRDYSGTQDELMEEQDREMEEWLRKEASS